MNKYIAVTALWVISWSLMIIVMIYGWGLEPKSWKIIIGLGIVGRISFEAMAIASKKDK